jgi:hypothetical protein
MIHTVSRGAWKPVPKRHPKMSLKCTYQTDLHIITIPEKTKRTYEIKEFAGKNAQYDREVPAWTAV